MEKSYTPQQLAPIAPGYPGSRPPKGWVPPLGAVLNLIGVYDLKSGFWVGLPIQALTEALVQAEKAYTVDRIDSRNGKAVTIANGTGLAEVVTGEIEVPADEVWYINRLSVTCPAADATGTASFNILVSSFPKVNGADKPYFASDRTAMGTTTDVDLPAQGELGAELRLVGGDKLTLRLTVTAPFTTDKTFRLDLYGRKAKRLVV